MSAHPETDSVIANIAQMHIEDRERQLAAHCQNLERQRNSLSAQLSESKSELESINRRIAHVCASLS